MPRLTYRVNRGLLRLVDICDRASTTRDVIGPPRLTRDGTAAYYSRRVTESDIWMMTLR